MDLVSIPANPVPEGAVTGTLKTRDGVEPALRALAAAAGPQGHRLHVPGPRRIHREIFRDRARAARARLRGRDARLARPGHVAAHAQRSAARAMSATSPNTSSTSTCSCARSCCRTARRRCSRIGHSMGGSVLIRIGASGHALVRPHGAVGADDRSRRHARLEPAQDSPRRLMRFAGMGSSYVPGGDAIALSARAVSSATR